MPTFTDQQELDGLRNLEPQTIAAVYDHYAADVYRYVRFRINDDAVAEDITSEVFVRLLEAAQTKRAPNTNLKGWLFSTASHIVADHYRRMYSRPTQDLPETLPDAAATPAQVTEQHERTDRVRDAMHQLASDHQRVLELRFNHSYSLEETAALMNRNVNAVKQLQLRALTALARVMGEQP